MCYPKFFGGASLKLKLSSKENKVKLSFICEISLCGEQSRNRI